MSKSLVKLVGEMHFPEKEQIFKFLDRHILQPEPLVIAVSGGCDSMLVSHLIISYVQYRQRPLDLIHIFHAHHGQRVESDQEMEWILKYFEDFKVHTPRYQGTSSSEHELRKRRHQEYETYLKTIGSTKLFVGHHLDDRIETTFLNLARGASWEGFFTFSGCDQMSTHQILRPLIDIIKERIISLCKILNIPYVHDVTNDDPDVSDRNILRLQILPQLYHLAQGKFVESMKHLYHHDLRKPDSFELQPLYVSPHWKIGGGRKVVASQGWTYQVIIELFKKFGIYTDIHQGLLDEWMDFMYHSSDGWKSFHGLIMVKSHKNWYIFEAKQPFWEVLFQDEKIITTLGSQNFGEYVLEVGNSEWLGSKLRFPREGDRMGSKSLAKVLINRKIPVFYRPLIPVIEKKGQIIGILIPTVLAL